MYAIPPRLDVGPDPLLDDFAAHEATADGRRRYAELSELARAQAARLRQLIEDN